MLREPQGVLRVTHFPWTTALLFPALSAALFGTARYVIAGRDDPSITYFVYLLSILSLFPVPGLTCTELRFDSLRDELQLAKRRWWQWKPVRETHRLDGLTAIVWRVIRRRPGPAFNFFDHERKTLAVFAAGREVSLFTHDWLPAGKSLARRLAGELGVEFRIEITYAE